MTKCGGGGAARLRHRQAEGANDSGGGADREYAAVAAYRPRWRLRDPCVLETGEMRWGTHLKAVMSPIIHVDCG
jgi:hypothetical protein